MLLFIALAIATNNSGDRYASNWNPTSSGPIGWRPMIATPQPNRSHSVSQSHFDNILQIHQHHDKTGFML